ncbi:MAG: S1 RNA-binding domain-containing protein [Bacteroidota bacterium]
MKDVGGHSSDRERLAMEAERASIKLTSAVMAENYIGEDFNGTITGVTSFGLFIMLDGFYAEGLLHMRDLHDDYYYYDEKNYRLIGKRHKKVFGFGKRLRVKLAKVNVDKRNIDLLLVDDRPYEEEMNTGI